MKHANNQTIEFCSQQIQIDPLHSQSYVLTRSEAFALDGHYDEAISDLSKLILVSPNRSVYVSRSALLRAQGKYLLALKDLQEASHLQSQGDTPADIYLQNSICVKKIREVQEIASILSTNQSNQQLDLYSQTVSKLLQIKDLKIKELQSERQQQIAQLKKYYEEQAKQLQDQLFEQLRVLKEKMNLNYVNYEAKFQQQLLDCHLNELQKTKLKIYFHYFSSEMEKYYVAAKNLHKIEDKTIKFQDFQSIYQNKDKSDILRKIFKLFDKYSSKVQCLQSVIKEVPYIGSVFKLIKGSMKPFGWLQQIDLKSQCENIERVAINTTAFNDFSTNLAYYFVRHFQKSILAQHYHHESGWELLINKITKIKDQTLGKSAYRYKMDEGSLRVREYAVIHASVLMVAYACNKLRFDRQRLKQVNRKYEKDRQIAEKWLGEIYQMIDKVEQSLTRQGAGDQPGKRQTVSNHYCEIY